MSYKDEPSEDDVRQCLDTVCDVAQLHTDVLIAVPSGGGNVKPASCLHIELDGRSFVVTCEHVLFNDHNYFTNAQRLPSAMVQESNYQTGALSLIDKSKDLDLAVFDGTELIQVESGKKVYQGSQSDWFTQERLSPPDGTAAYLYGLLGNKAKAHQYEDGLFYMEAPIYTGIGPLVEVTENELIGDFAEKKFLTLNDKEFPQLENEKPTGGVRELGGTSGSGFWMIRDKTPYLVGIILGRRQSPQGTHLVRATPVWALFSWLRTL